MVKIDQSRLGFADMQIFGGRFPQGAGVYWVFTCTGNNSGTH